jgi:hypothetical protein
MSRKPKPPRIGPVFNRLNGYGAEAKVIGNCGAFAIRAAGDDMQCGCHALARGAVSYMYKQRKFTSDVKKNLVQLFNASDKGKLRASFSEPL